MIENAKTELIAEDKEIINAQLKTIEKIIDENLITIYRKLG